mgnify:CR=1 FL=1
MKNSLFVSILLVALSVPALRPAHAQVLVTNTTPPNGAHAYSRSGNVIAQFNTAMRGSTITSNRFFVVSRKDGYRNGAITFNATTNQATLNPTADFRAGEFLTAQLTRGITNSAGTTELTNHTWQFYAATRTNGGAFVKQDNASYFGSYMNQLRLGDLNGDGYLDCMMLCYNGGYIYTNIVWTNNGNGVLMRGQLIGPRGDTGLAMGDVDRDGDLDAILMNDSQTNQLWINNGAAVFSWFQDLTNVASAQVTLDDINADGWLDMILIRESGGGVIYTNNRAGRLYDSGQRLTGSNTRSVSIGDVNGDGFVDALMGSMTGVQVFTNNGSGVFSDAARNFSSGTVRDIRLGDLDGNGSLDALLGRGFAVFQVYTNNGSGMFSAIAQVFTINSEIVELADMNGDATLDIVTAKYLYLNNGQASFTQSPAVDFGGFEQSGFDTGDVDNDGDVDMCLITWDYFGESAIWKNVLPAMGVLGTNRAVIVSGAAASTTNGTDFGVVLIGTSRTNQFSITNNGPVALSISGVSTSGAGAARFVAKGLPATVQAGGVSNFTVAFTPSAAGAATASLVLDNNSSNTPYSVSLRGVGLTIILTAAAGTNGSIVPSGEVAVNAVVGTNFLIRSSNYYHIGSIVTNGGAAPITDPTNMTFTWNNLTANGTITVSFAENLAAHGTPEWWLAQFGWTQYFDAVESADQDGDGLFTWQEFPSNTCPTNANTDGDQFDDGVEINSGADALHDDSRTYGAILGNPALFGLYTSNTIMDLSYGEVMLEVVTNNLRIQLTLEASETLGGNTWSNVGSAVEWQYPAFPNKYFFRFLGGP